MVQKDGDNYQEGGQSVSRRRLLALGAAGISAGIAGCGSGTGDPATTTAQGGSDGGDGGDTTTSTEDDEFFEGRYWTQRVGTPPADLNHQYYRTNSDWYVRSLIHTWSANDVTREPLGMVGILLSDWGLQDDGVTYRMELNDDFYWHDGKNVTAEDLALEYELIWWMQAGQSSAWLDLVEGGTDVPGGRETALPEVVDDYTLEFTFTEAVNPDIVDGEMLGEPYMLAPQQYGQFVEEFRDASSMDEISQIRTELANEVDFDTDIGFGPLALVDQNERFLTLEFFEDYPWETVQRQLVETIGPDNVSTDVRGWGRPNFEGLELKFLEGNNSMRQEVLANAIDGGVGPYIDENQLPEGRVSPLIPALWGQGIMFNMWDWGPEPGDPYLNPRKFDGANDVRKGLAHAVDRELAGRQLGGGPPVPTDEYFTGMLAAQEAAWLGDDFMDNLRAWKQDYDETAEYFERAGFSMQNGVWHTPEGEPWQPVIKDGAGVTRYVNMWEVASSNFERAGIDVQVEFEENSTFYPKDQNARGFDLSTGFYGGGRPHAYFAHQWTWLREAETEEGGDVKDTWLPGNPIEGEREYVEVPPVGEWDSSERLEVEPGALVSELRVTTDEARASEIIELLSWAANWWIPKITLHEHQSAYHLNGNGWTFPDPTAPEMAISPGFNSPFHFGVIRATGE